MVDAGTSRDAPVSSGAERLRQLVADARRPVAFTGAGISVASGLPTYRGPDGIWTRDPSAEAKSSPPPAKMCDPDRRRRWWDDLWSQWGPLRALVAANAPSAAHVALADWEQRVDQLVVITQNVDGLHQRAGSTAVVELHGTIWKNRCAKDRCRQQPWDDEVPRTTAPDCPRCGRPARPDVVLFTENLTPAAWNRAAAAIGAADLVLVIGASGAVAPAGNLPLAAAERKVPVARLDPGPWLGLPLDWAAEIAAPATALEVLVAA